MSSLGIFNKETKTYQKVAGTAEAAVVDAEMSDKPNRQRGTSPADLPYSFSREKEGK